MARRSAKAGKSRQPATRGGSGGGSSRIKSSGMGVTIKVSLATAGTLAVCMVVFTLVVSSMVRTNLSEEVDAAGVMMAQAIAGTPFDSWKREYGTSLEEGAQQGTTAEKAVVEYNNQRASRIAQSGGVKVLDVAILSADKTTVVNGARSIALRGVKATREAADGAVKITEGTYAQSNRSSPARTYEAAMTNRRGEVEGHVIVALSEAAISRRLGRLRMILLTSTAIFVGLGLIVSWFVAERITRPVAILGEDMDLVAEGDLEHRTRAHSSDEIGVLARRFDRMTQSLAAARELERKQAQQDHQMEITKEVQSALFVEELPRISGYELAGSSRAAGAVAADFYHVEQTDGGLDLIVVSASGSGIPAAMITIMARSLIKAAGEVEGGPADQLRRINRQLAPDLRRGMYVSVLLARLDPASGVATVASAGENPLLLIPPRSKAAEPLHLDGIALGFDKGPMFDRNIREERIQLDPGARLVMLTQALYAIRNEDGEEIGEEALRTLIGREAGKHSDVFTTMLWGAIDRFRGDAELQDDLTLLTLKRV